MSQKFTVEVRNGGIPHFLAHCHHCDWNYQNYIDRRRGQAAIRKHVADTGHTVALEKMHVVYYTARGET
jgi:L-asparaginase II